MSVTLRRKALTAIALLVLTLLSGLSLNPRAVAQEAAAPTSREAASTALTADEAIDRITSQDGLLRFDAAEDMTRFVFAAAPVHEDGLPAYGNAFITQGYLYPYGTLGESNGVLPDGSPEFPDEVLGEWTCRGWFVGDGAHTTSGAMVITTQVYRFGDGQADSTILISEGYELADVGVAIERAITGGTGPFATVRGDGQQTFLGFNETQGVNLRFELAPQS